MRRIVLIFALTALSVAVAGQNDKGIDNNAAKKLNRTGKTAEVESSKPGEEQRPLSPISGENAGISCQMEELTSPQFSKAVVQAGGVLRHPAGPSSKSIPHIFPWEQDLYEARASVIRAAEKEYAVVFPPYFVGQILRRNISPAQLHTAMSSCGRCSTRPARSSHATG